MGDSRRPGGRETWHRLREWDKGQSESERLAARLLPLEGYQAIDPSHPLGGKDGGKDVLCLKEGKTWIVAVYFPRGQQPIGTIKAKFQDDLKKVGDHKPHGMLFFTNQELTLSEREDLETLATPLECEIYHLERVASCLDTPRGYGLRLEFLSIDMTREEQISYFNDRDKMLLEIQTNVALLVEKKRPSSGITTVHVDAHQYDQLYGVTTFGQSKLMKCRKCGEVFRATKNPFGSMSVTFLANNIETVTCPECGKVQAF